jgi:hypothetical protein
MEQPKVGPKGEPSWNERVKRHREPREDAVQGLKATAMKLPVSNLLTLQKFRQFCQKNHQLLPTHFHKINNPRPGKEAAQPQSTDGKQNELNDRRITEKETKLVKNRNKITTEDTESTEGMRCKDSKQPHSCTPAIYFAVNLKFC